MKKIINCYHNTKFYIERKEEKLLADFDIDCSLNHLFMSSSKERNSFIKKNNS